MLAARRKLNTQLDAADPRQAAKMFQDIGAMVLPTLRVTFAVTDEGDTAPNTRRWVFTVADMRNTRQPGRFSVIILIAPALDADPDPTGNTVSFPLGTFCIETLLPGCAYRVLTDSEGRAMMDLTVAGAAQRVCYAKAEESFWQSEPKTYA